MDGLRAGEMEYIFRGEISFSDKRISETIFKAIYNDIIRERLKDVHVKLELSGHIVKCEIRSKSFAKFRGFVNTLLRLINLTSLLISSLDKLSNN